jgi:hypothetical protein
MSTLVSGVFFEVMTGHPTAIASTMRRRVSAYTRDCSFKIGITCNPDARWQAHKHAYDQMVVVCESSSIDCVSQLERELTDHNQDFADNVISGGGGHIGKRGPYYLYVLLRD